MGWPLKCAIDQQLSVSPTTSNMRETARHAGGTLRPTQQRLSYHRTAEHTVAPPSGLTREVQPHLLCPADQSRDPSPDWDTRVKGRGGRPKAPLTQSWDHRARQPHLRPTCQVSFVAGVNGSDGGRSSATSLGGGRGRRSAV